MGDREGGVRRAKFTGVEGCRARLTEDRRMEKNEEREEERKERKGGTKLSFYIGVYL